METIPRATQVLAAGSWPAASASDRITLTYEERHRRRLRFTAEGGLAFLLDLARATVLHAGDGLKLDDGRIVRVEAAPEPLLAVGADSPQHLLRLAWHIGNRHLPAQLAAARILIREDAVIEDMLRGLGAVIEHVAEPFTPEPGAYDQQGHSMLLLPGAHRHANAP
jgi:urease accessory protein